MSSNVSISEAVLDNLRLTLKSPHFWMVGIVTLALIAVYLAWPWREWVFSQSPWHWFSWLSGLYDLALFELRFRLIGSLFLIPIIYASVRYGWRGSLVVFIVALAGMFPLLREMWVGADSFLTNVTLLMLPTVVILAAHIELELRQKDKRVFAEREKERQMYLAKILETQEKERQRLAEELHDESIQALVAVASYAEFIESEDVRDVEEIKKRASWIKETTRSTIQDLRRISVDLRPGVLDNMGLVPALKWLTERTSAQHNIHIRLTTNGLDTAITPSMEVTIFRIVQEALQNIVRHSKATEATISLRAEAACLRITVQDNGRGFVPPAKYANLVTQDKLGLVGMHERVRSLGGTFELRSKPGEGTLLCFEIPIA